MAYSRFNRDNLSQSCKRYLPYVPIDVHVAVSRSYAFPPDVTQMLDNASDIKGAIVIT